MCGLAAILNYDGSPVNDRNLLDMRDLMVHRGPDGTGLWLSPDRAVGLAHRRLAIVGLGDSGAQPMSSSDGSCHIVFNGEIYNYRELRTFLRSKGVTFRSSSDTEVLLYLYREEGERMLSRLRGMYAFVIWDSLRQRLFAARDPFGIKPLYYADDGRSVYFASQVKAVLKNPRVDDSPEPAGIVGFLALGYVPEPFTLYRAISPVPPGARISIYRDGRRSVAHFCRLEEELANAERNPADRRRDGPQYHLRVRESLRDSVAAHCIADVPVALFLSAGLDSGAMAGLAAETGQRLSTLTVGFEELRGGPNDETEPAILTARRFATDHHTSWVSINDFEKDLDRIFAAMDQPSIDGVNTWFVSKAAHQLGIKAALSGLGGDELFGTYSSFRDIPRIVGLLGKLPITTLGAAFRRLSSPVLGKLHSEKAAAILEYGNSYPRAYYLRRALFMPWELKTLLPREMAREGWQRLNLFERMEQTVAALRSPRLKVSALEMTWYMRNQLLRDADWAGMAHSVEIRVPFVDLQVLRSLSPLLAVRPLDGKKVLARVPAKGLPSEVEHRDKTGFLTPLHKWIAASGSQSRPRDGNRAWALRLAREFKIAA